MKQFISIICITIVSVSLMAQGGKKPMASSNRTTSAPGLKTMSDSVSYAVGVSVANFYHQQGIKNLNSSIVSKAINDVFSGKKVVLDDNTCNDVLNTYLRKKEEEKNKAVLDSGAKFLNQNKKRPGVRTTASGLQYEVIVEGTGTKPSASDSVTCNYKGVFLNGTEFDNSYKRGEPATFALNRVIAGWTEGLQLMSTGSKYKFYIPYNLAYGIYDYNNIPGGSTLIFEVELLGIKKPITQ